MTPEIAYLEIFVDLAKWASIIPPVLGLVGVAWLLFYFRAPR
tara:strand:- start:376 stop:501 length:126 start_codon:yes stop_codon:yes gene_type:complete